ncbi:MAG TPA: hypothetical protein VHD34_02645 [Xanthobacteraceae bacterium]|jgi:hypothetical protein|nr:hypothetical protein [Xanthobacteraceae bacterium]HVV96361.1 hypothetical protein [Rhodanobacteraceae bacterium]
MTSTIKEPTLRELAEAQSLSGVVALGQRGGYALTVRYGMTETQRLLATARGETRVFSNLNTLADFLRKLGITRFEIDATDYERARVRAARPDRREAMKRTRSRPTQAALQF